MDSVNTVPDGPKVTVGSNVYLLPTSTVKSDREAKDRRQAIYMAWLIQPKDEREPRTKQAMAEVLGVTVQTLFNYERDPDFAGAVRERLSRAFKVDRLPNLFESLYATATDPENPRQVTAARTLLEWFGRSDAAQGAAAELANLSLEELEAVAAADA